MKMIDIDGDKNSVAARDVININQSVTISGPYIKECPCCQNKSYKYALTCKYCSFPMKKHFQDKETGRVWKKFVGFLILVVIALVFSPQVFGFWFNTIVLSAVVLAFFSCRKVIDIRSGIPCDIDKYKPE